jgi:putative FmdB family regulatory protein
MPIYAYACGACGFKKDVLQKLSDAPLTDCPSCGQSQFSKQLTAPGFVLKGSGWYVTDFREGQKKPTDAGAATADPSSSDSKPPA